MEGSLTFLSFISCIGIFLGITLSSFLVFNKSVKNKANIYLGLLVFFSFLYLVRPFLFFTGWLEYLPHTLKVEGLGGFVFGPLVYFYVRACTQNNFKMRPILALHFIPVVFDVIYHIPIFALTSSEKIDIVRNFMINGELLVSLLTPLVKIISTGIYFVISTKLIIQYRNHLNNTASFIDVAFHRWLMLFCSYLVFPFFVMIVYVVSENQVTGINVYYFGWTSFIVAVYFSTFLKPEIFHAFPHQMPLPNSTEQKTQKYESSKLQDAQKEIYLTKLIQYVEGNKLYLETELTLAQVAEKTKIPAHYLSQVINEKLNCNFIDFINNYRVEEAKDKLLDDKYDHYTIIAIAYESGFNSKSAFYPAFKKITGMTPSKFRKSLVEVL